MTDKIHFESSTGNVFKDIGLSNPKYRIVKARIASKILDMVKEKGITDSELARIFEMKEEKAVGILCGKLDGISDGRLDYCLRRAREY